MLDVILLLALAAPAPETRAAPPLAAVKVVEDTYFGETIADPYRWLEDVSSEPAQTWMRAQADHARATLDAIPGRAALLSRLDALERATPARTGVVRYTAGGDVFFLRRAAGEEVGKLYVRGGWDGTDRLLFDPETRRRETGKPHALNWFHPSPDGKHVAIGVSASGSEDTVLDVLETATGKRVDGPIDRTQFGGLSWLPDGSGFVFNRHAEPRKGQPASERWLHSQAWLHRLGEPLAKDRVVFGTRFAQELPITPEDAAFVQLTSASPWAIGVKNTANATQGFFVAPAADIGKDALAWRPLYDYADGVRIVQASGDHAYALVMKGSANGRIVKRPLAGDGEARVIYEGRGPIDAIGVAKDAIYLRERDGVYERLLRIGFDGGEPEEIDLGPRGSFVGTSGGEFASLALPELEGVTLLHGTWTRTDRVMRVVAGRRRAVDTGLMAQPKGIDTSTIVVEDLVATSHDGAKVPLSLLRPRDAKRDGTNRVLLVGYGSYGISNAPFLDPTFLAWPEHGVSRATCHVRGGGELGEAWYRGGFHAKKANTWKDFIACAERLVELGYTKPSLIAGTGTSAGGILIGNAMIERPELFAAAIPNVGALDTLRLVLASQNGPGHYAEIGDPRTREGFAHARLASAYLKLRDGVAYPPTLLVHGVNDPRVDVWQSTKFGARLAAASTRGPVLLRLDYESGHGVGTTRSARLAEEADRLAFVLWQTGAKGYQPAPQ